MNMQHAEIFAYPISPVHDKALLGRAFVKLNESPALTRKASRRRRALAVAQLGLGTRNGTIDVPETAWQDIALEAKALVQLNMAEIARPAMPEKSARGH
jgi:hypothetical protein